MIALPAELETDVKYDIIDGVELAKLKLMPRHLLVRWGDRKETKHGIIMPQNRLRAGIMKGTILAVGPECDARIVKGDIIQFIALCEKEFLGGETPGDRDPVFFMRDENVIGIHMGPGALELLNDFLLVSQDRAPEEKAGIKILNRDQKTEMRSGIVVRLDNSLSPEDVGIGQRIYYHQSTADEMKLGDFDGQLVHVVRWRFVEVIAEDDKGAE